LVSTSKSRIWTPSCIITEKKNRSTSGDTENAGLENGGPKKYQRLENAGLKMEDQMSVGGKCRTGKWRTKCH